MKLNISPDLQLPYAAVTQTFAILAIRGAGKTCTAIVIAEEMCRAGIPWICFDPVGVWWGLRATPDGKPGGFPVVVIGGEHGDLPLERLSGAKMAEALLTEPVAAVIDLSQESKKFWHTFMTDFCLTMMSMTPDIPRHLFIEEAPEFCPQRTRFDLTARTKEAVERVIRLGRNRGYGCTLISQRPATIDKDVLSQCENLLVMRTVGPHDRKALTEWIEAKATDRKVEKFLDELADLPNGTAWFWSPHWLHEFKRVAIRARETFHPGATRSMGVQPKQVELIQVKSFVGRLQEKLARATKQSVVTHPRKDGGIVTESMAATTAIAEQTRLRQENADLRGRLADAERRLVIVKSHLAPQYQAMRRLFEEIGQDGAASTVDRGAYEPWLAKAGKAGTRRLLETMIDRRELSVTQLATLAGLGPNTGTYRNYLSWLRRNGLIETNEGMVRLVPL